MTIWKPCPCGKRLATRPSGLCGRCDVRVPKPGEPVCRHCSKKKANRPRGLCWTCYYTPGVLDLYPSTSKYAPKSSCWEEEPDGGATPAEPTDAPPGSLAKMRVMRQRLLRRETLFHPLDNKVVDGALVNPLPGKARGRGHDEPTGLDDDEVATLPPREAA